MKDLHNKLLQVLHTSPDIVKKYNIYNNRFITTEQKDPLGLNVIIINPVTQNIHKEDIYNSEVFNYFAVFVNDKVYIINRQNVIEDIRSNIIQYSFSNAVYLNEEYLTTHSTRLLKYEI